MTTRTTVGPIETPVRSREQRIDALKKANHIRITRAGVKHDLKRGRRAITDLLLEPTPEIETAKVIDMLLATPKIGRVKAAKILNDGRISPSKTIGGLTPRQRAVLASAFM